MPNERQQTGLLPLLAARELHVAEHHPGQLMRALGVRMGERHRHVQVGGARLEGSVEDRLVEARIAGVQDGIGAHPLDQLHERRTIGGVHPLGGEAVGFAELGHHIVRARRGHVRERHLLERGPTLGYRRERRTNTAGSNHEHAHRRV